MKDVLCWNKENVETIEEGEELSSVSHWYGFAANNHVDPKVKPKLENSLQLIGLDCLARKINDIGSPWRRPQGSEHAHDS